MSAFLQVRDLHVQFPTEDGVVNAVDGVSFDLERGRTLAIVGESGSGKSVTAQAIMGLLNRQVAQVSGQVLLDGADLIAMDDDGIRHLRGKQMAMVFQDPMSSLHPYYRVGDQLVEAVLVHQKMSKQQAREQRRLRVLLADRAERLPAGVFVFGASPRARDLTSAELAVQVDRLVDTISHRCAGGKS